MWDELIQEVIRVDEIEDEVLFSLEKWKHKNKNGWTKIKA